MSDDKILGGPSPTAVVGAGSIASDTASHAARKCQRVGDVTEHYTAKDGDIHCECGQVDTTLPVSLFTPTTNLSMDEELEALRAFAAKLERMSANGQRAAIFWLVDFFIKGR